MQKELQKAAMAAGGVYAYVYKWSPEIYGQLTTEIIDYFKANTFTEVPGTVVPTSEDGKIGFTSSTSFSCFYPNGASSCTYAFPSSTLTAYSDFEIRTAYSSFPQITSGNFRSGFNMCNSDGFGFVFFSPNSEPLGGRTFYSSNNNTFVGKISSSGPEYMLFSPKFYNQSTYPIYSSYYYAFYDSRGNYYGLKTINGALRFYNLSNNSLYYNDLSFSSYYDVCLWFYHSCGFVVPNNSSVSAYSAPVVDSNVTFDEDTATAVRTANVASAEEVGSISTVIPSSYAELEVLSNNPAVVTDVSAAAELVAIYPEDLPKIDKSPALWQTKFPFCIPFDLARIVGDLQAPPEAPELSFIILPENFFGLGNDSYYVEINFSLFTEFISILRFFISLGFVLFLILITRDIIKG